MHLRLWAVRLTVYLYEGDHKAHGFYADGSQSNGTSLGFWTVFSNMEGYTGGPLRSDLVVDTNIYNCGFQLSVDRRTRIFN